MEMLRQEIAGVYAKQKKTLADGSFLPPQKRIEALKKLEASIRRHEKELIQAMIDDFNKPELEIVETETALVLSELKHTIRRLKRWARPKRVKTPIHQLFTTSRIYKEPYGTVLIMSPWNYPFQLLMMPALSALAAGNTVVLRPSTQTRRTAEVTAAIFKEALPPELAYVVLCDSSKADVLLEFQWDFLFFTGSRAVGISIYQKVAENLTPAILELGGKSPFIVTENADLKFAAQKLVWGKMLNAGQTCVAPDYVIAHQSVKDRFLAFVNEEFKKRFRQTDSDDRLPHLISDRAYNRLLKMIEEAEKAGCTVTVCGGHRPQERLMAPVTIDINDASTDLECLKEEIFGPVLPVLPYETVGDLEQIIGRNPQPLAFYLFSKRQPLAFYLFSKSKKETDALVSRFKFGGGCVNEVIIHLANPHLPFGGVGNSGIGFYHGRLGFEAFSHSKGVVEKRLSVDWPFIYRPYTKTKTAVIRFFLDR